MDKNKEIPSASYTFNGNVGTLIHHVDTLNMSVDKDMNVQIQNLDQLQSEQPAQPSAAIDPTPLIFKPNEQNPAAIEELLKSTLTISTKKSVICRKLYEQRALYNLHAQDDSTKAAIINAWIDKFGITIKTPFTRHDFGENYCK